MHLCVEHLNAFKKHYLHFKPCIPINISHSNVKTCPQIGHMMGHRTVHLEV